MELYFGEKRVPLAVQMRVLDWFDAMNMEFPIPFGGSKQERSRNNTWKIISAMTSTRICLIPSHTGDAVPKKEKMF